MGGLLMQEIVQVVQVMLKALPIMVQEVRAQEVVELQVVRDLVRGVLEALAKLYTDFYELIKKGK